MLTGQHGMTTLLAEAEEPLKEWDVLDYVKVRTYLPTYLPTYAHTSAHLPTYLPTYLQSLYEGTDRLFIPEVKFLWNRPNVAVFDLDYAKARAVMAKVGRMVGR